MGRLQAPDRRRRDQDLPGTAPPTCVPFWVNFPPLLHLFGRLECVPLAEKYPHLESSLYHELIELKTSGLCPKLNSKIGLQVRSMANDGRPAYTMQGKWVEPEEDERPGR